GISEKRILTLYNWSLVEKKPSKVEDTFSFSSETFNVVYAGNIGVHQGLSLLMDAYKENEKELPQIHFHFFGDGTDYEVLKNKISKNSLKNITLYGRVSSDEIYKYLNAADCLFLHLILDPIYESIIPSKLQAYIEVGKPILGGVQGEARELILANSLGEVFVSENNKEMVIALEKLYNYSLDKVQDIGYKSKKLYTEEFSREAGVNKVNLFIKEKLSSKK